MKRGLTPPQKPEPLAEMVLVRDYGRGDLAQWEPHWVFQNRRRVNYGEFMRISVGDFTTH